MISDMTSKWAPPWPEVVPNLIPKVVTDSIPKLVTDLIPKVVTYLLPKAATDLLPKLVTNLVPQLKGIALRGFVKGVLLRWFRIIWIFDWIDNFVFVWFALVCKVPGIVAELWPTKLKPNFQLIKIKMLVQLFVQNGLKNHLLLTWILPPYFSKVWPRVGHASRRRSRCFFDLACNRISAILK